MLIVESNPVCRLALVMQFKTFGVLCDISLNNDAAIQQVIERLQSGEPFYQLILIDWQSEYDSGARLVDTICERVNITVNWRMS